MTDEPAPDLSGQDSKPYWEAANEGRLVIQRCRDCSAAQLYFRAMCRSCWSRDIEIVEASGTGTVYSYTVQHYPGPALAAEAPYVLAIVELAEGPRLVTRVVDAVESVAIGDSVRVTFQRQGGRMLPYFERVES